MTLERTNLLILDEPTNHLDVENIEALEDALEAYEGSVLLVSHDRAFLREVATRVWSFDGDRLTRVSFAHKDVDSPYAWQKEKDPEKQEEKRARKREEEQRPEPTPESSSEMSPSSATASSSSPWRGRRMNSGTHLRRSRCSESE